MVMVHLSIICQVNSQPYAPLSLRQHEKSHSHVPHTISTASYYYCERFGLAAVTAIQKGHWVVGHSHEMSFLLAAGYFYGTFGKILRADRAVPVGRFDVMAIVTPYTLMHIIRLFALHVWIVLLQNTAEQGNLGCCQEYGAHSANLECWQQQWWISAHHWWTFLRADYSVVLEEAPQLQFTSPLEKGRLNVITHLVHQWQSLRSHVNREKSWRILR